MLFVLIIASGGSFHFYNVGGINSWRSGMQFAAAGDDAMYG